MSLESTAANSRKRWLLIAMLLIVISAGALVYRYFRQNSGNSLACRPVPTPDFDVPPTSSGNTTGPAVPHSGDFLITIQPEKLANAQLKIEPVIARLSSPMTAGGLRTAGTVEVNAYKSVPVLPIAGGIVRQVNFQLGDKIELGQKLATIFSTELADAQTVYLNVQAEMEKHHHMYKRAEQLVEIGATSREEFEQAAAEYKIEQAKLTAARQRLLLLGMNAKQIDDLNNANQMSAVISVEAPASGVIITRAVNPGEVVTMGKELFRIADLSTVWVIGQIYEKDFALVRAGSTANITTFAYPGRTFTGKVSYIDPRVEPQTRTAQLRIEVKNPGEMLKLGMFVDITFGVMISIGNSQQVAAVPRRTVQVIGDKQFVFVATEKPGVFSQRQVSAGAEANGLTPIYDGVSVGESVVTEGSFLLRAESLRLNPDQLAASVTQSASKQSLIELPGAKGTRSSQARMQSVTVTLNEKGFHPDSFKLLKGVPARITFVRKVESGCGTEVVLEDYNIKRELPFDQPVTVEITPAKTGEFKFACGMDMLRGKIIVR